MSNLKYQIKKKFFYEKNIPKDLCFPRVLGKQLQVIENQVLGRENLLILPRTFSRSETVYPELGKGRT